MAVKQRTADGHLDDDQRRQRRKRRTRLVGDHLRQPPGQPGRTPRLGDRADLCPGRRRPRDRARDPLPHPLHAIAERSLPDCAAAGDPSPVVTAACQSSFSTAIALISMRYSGDVIFVTSTIVDAGNGSLKYSPRTAWINGKCSMLRT